MRIFCWLFGHFWITATDWVHNCPVQVCQNCGLKEDLPYSVKPVAHQPRA